MLGRANLKVECQSSSGTNDHGQGGHLKTASGTGERRWWAGGGHCRGSRDNASGLSRAAGLRAVGLGSWDQGRRGLAWAHGHSAGVADNSGGRGTRNADRA